MILSRWILPLFLSSALIGCGLLGGTFSPPALVPSPTNLDDQAKYSTISEPPPFVCAGAIRIAADIYFASDSSKIEIAERWKLDRILDMLGWQKVNLVAVGHTDSIGAKNYNQDLSLRRAEAVRRYLIEGRLHIESSGVEGKGESSPRQTNETDAGRKKNRVVELEIVGGGCQTRP